MILGLYKPTSGQVCLKGVSVNDYDCKTFYKEIYYVSQDEMLLNESVLLSCYIRLMKMIQVTIRL